MSEPTNEEVLASLQKHLTLRSHAVVWSAKKELRSYQCTLPGGRVVCRVWRQLATDKGYGLWTSIWEHSFPHVYNVDQPSPEDALEDMKEQLRSYYQSMIDRLPPVPVGDTRRFKIMGGHRMGLGSIPWQLILRHEAQVKENHGDTLERLHERGGLSVEELWFVLQDKKITPLTPFPTEREAYEFVSETVRGFEEHDLG